MEDYLSANAAKPFLNIQTVDPAVAYKPLEKDYALADWNAAVVAPLLKADVAGAEAKNTVLGG